jgi:3-dehydroquinate dehydratase/predicted esterase
LQRWGSELGVDVDHFQANAESELVARLHTPGVDGLIVNPGALTHYSYSLYDALAAVRAPIVEVHISNLRQREAWRRHSVTAAATDYQIYGRGISGYRWAIRHLHNQALFPSAPAAYGAYPDQIGDLRSPAGASSLVMLVHGGLWRDEWTRDTTESLAVALAERGWATWNLEYRRVGRGGGWPESFEDIARALEAAERLTGIPPDRTAVVGHSAGGTMALWSAGAAKVRPAMVVGLAAITDLERAATDGLGEGAVSRLLGRARPDPADLSPLHRLPNPVPAVLLQAADDGLVPADYGAEYAAHAAAAGSPTGLQTVAGGHLSLLEPSGEHFEHLVRSLDAHCPAV